MHSATPQLSRPGRLIVFGTILGLWYGLVEASGFMTASLVPGVLSWRAANSLPVFIVAPLVYGVLFGMLAAIAAAIGRVIPRLPVDRAFVFACAALGGFFLVTIPGQFLGGVARGILGLGIGAAVLRLYTRYAAEIQRHARRSTVALALLLPILALGVTLVPRAMETRGVSRLPAAPAGAPNVLLLVMDGQRADRLSSYGARRRTSPELDSLASSGLLFEYAFASSSWTLPTHATMFTGRHQHEHRAGIMRRPFLDGRFPTVAEVLAARGYLTGGFVANTYWCGRQTGLARGFLHYEDMFGNLADALTRTVVGRLLVYDVLPRLGMRDVPGRKRAEDLNASLLAWVDGREDRPFFAFVNYFDVHAPYEAPRPFRGRFSNASDRGAPETALNLGAPTALRVSPEELAEWLDGYDESLAYVDHELGRLFDSLRERGLLDNTLIIVTSDHGEGFGEHGLGGHGNSLYSNQLLVPLIVHWPARLRTGKRETRPVGLDRIASTIADAAGVAPNPFPGASLLDSAATEFPRAELARRFPVAGPWPSSRTSLRAVVSGRWLYVRPDSGEAELYDYIADPGDLVNLIRTEEGLKVAPQLEAELERRRAPSARADPD